MRKIDPDLTRNQRLRHPASLFGHARGIHRHAIAVVGGIEDEAQKRARRGNLIATRHERRTCQMVIGKMRERDDANAFFVDELLEVFFGIQKYRQLVQACPGVDEIKRPIGGRRYGTRGKLCQCGPDLGGLTDIIETPLRIQARPGGAFRGRWKMIGAAIEVGTEVDILAPNHVGHLVEFGGQGPDAALAARVTFPGAELGRNQRLANDLLTRHQPHDAVAFSHRSQLERRDFAFHFQILSQSNVRVEQRLTSGFQEWQQGQIKPDVAFDELLGNPASFFRHALRVHERAISTVMGRKDRLQKFPRRVQAIKALHQRAARKMIVHHVSKRLGFGQ